jgi:hypothetical protein
MRWQRTVMTVGSVMLIAGLAGCGDSDDQGDDSSTTITVSAAGVSLPEMSDGEVTVTPAFSIDGVIAAAILLAEGDAEQAVADGVVTAVEVDAAAEAIREGTLDAWVTAAGG